MNHRRIFLTKTFRHWAGKAGLTDAALIRAVSEMESGLIDADLGGGVFKKRVGLRTRGKSRGLRVLLATRFEGRWFFLFGFDKNEKANLDLHGLEIVKELAGEFLLFGEREILTALEAGKLEEVIDHVG